jgi:hypothetical protein
MIKIKDMFLRSFQLKRPAATTTTTTRQKAVKAVKAVKKAVPESHQPKLPANRSHTLCQSCGDMESREVRGSLSLMRLKHWQDYISLFWAQHPYWFKVAKYLDLLLLLLAICAAYFPEWRDDAVYLGAAAVFVMVVKEYVPAVPLPFNVYNVITSRADQYTTATKAALIALLYCAAMGAALMVAEQMGNFMHNSRTAYTSPATSVWSDSFLPWVTMAMFVAPCVYFAALQVSTFYVQPQINALHPSYKTVR